MTTPAALEKIHAFRVGVSGAREIPADQLNRVTEEIGKVLDAIVARAQHGERCAIRFPRPDVATGGAVLSALRVVSPLAAGADQIVAEAAVSRGFELDVVLPFAEADYRRDFDLIDDAALRALAIARFDTLLDKAEGRVLVLDGERHTEADKEVAALAPNEPQSDSLRAKFGDRVNAYEATGRIVVRNCDLQIAIWDGLPGKGRGGTADIVRYCAQYGGPVWLISPTKDRAPKWIFDARDFFMHATARPSGQTTAEEHSLGQDAAAARAALTAYIDASLGMPEPMDSAPSVFEPFKWISHHHSVFRCWWAGVPRHHPIASMHQRQVPGRGGIWTTYSRVLSLFGTTVVARPDGIEMNAECPPTWAYWNHHYSRYDDYASSYAHRHRSSFVLALLFAAIALVCGMFGFRHEALAIKGIEVAALLGVLAMVSASRIGQWHEWMVSYRLLAELCRKQQFLSQLGASLPVANVSHAMGGQEVSKDAIHVAGATEHQGQGALSLALVGWQFQSLLRAAPLAAVDFHDSRVLQGIRNRIAAELIDEQLNYHTNRGHPGLFGMGVDGKAIRTHVAHHAACPPPFPDATIDGSAGAGQRGAQSSACPGPQHQRRADRAASVARADGRVAAPHCGHADGCDGLGAAVTGQGVGSELRDQNPSVCT